MNITIPIPKDATNGDMIKVMFPNLIITVFENAHIPCVSVMGENYEFNLTFPLKWWNAPFKQENKIEADKENDNTRPYYANEWN